MRKNNFGLMPLFALLFVALDLVNGDEQQDSVSFRIIGGVPAEPGEFPSMAAPQSLSRFISLCGGSVIDNRHILTAAHCVDNELKYIVKLGCQNRWQCDDAVYQIEDFKTHPSYNSDGKTFTFNDIAIMRTDRPIQFTGPQGSGSVRPISIANSIDDDYHEGDLLTAAGWGRTSLQFPEVTSGNLLKTSLRALSPGECYDKFKFTNTTATICARAPTADVCNGDSGGPLMRTLADGSKQLVGIVSWGGCQVEFGGLFTRVSAFNDWIEGCKRNWNSKLM